MISDLQSDDVKLAVCFHFKAEDVGFEPTERYSRSLVFKTSTLDHSANLPY
jgi:hypothetical protein